MDAAGTAIGTVMNGASMGSAETGIMTDGAITIMMGGVIASGAVTGNSMATTDTGIDLGSTKKELRTAGEEDCQPFLLLRLMLLKQWRPS